MLIVAYCPINIFHLVLSFWYSLYVYLPLLFSLFFLISEFFISYLSGIDWLIGNVSHVFCYFLISKLMVFIQFDSRIEFFEVILGPLVIAWRRMKCIIFILIRWALHFLLEPVRTLLGTLDFPRYLEFHSQRTLSQRPSPFRRLESECIVLPLRWRLFIIIKYSISARRLNRIAGPTNLLVILNIGSIEGRKRRSLWRSINTNILALLLLLIQIDHFIDLLFQNLIITRIFVQAWWYTVNSMVAIFPPFVLADRGWLLVNLA